MRYLIDRFLSCRKCNRHLGQVALEDLELEITSSCGVDCSKDENGDTVTTITITCPCGERNVYRR